MIGQSYTVGYVICTSWLFDDFSNRNKNPIIPSLLSFRGHGYAYDGSRYSIDRCSRHNNVRPSLVLFRADCMILRNRNPVNVALLNFHRSISGQFLCPALKTLAVLDPLHPNLAQTALAQFEAFSNQHRV